MTSQATKNRLRALRKKHHLGEFRKSFKKRRSHSIKSHGGLKMKRRKGKSYRKSSGGLSGVTSTALGVGGYILFESMIEPKILAMANISNPMLVNIGELVLGMYMAKKSGVIGSVGKAAIVVNLYQLLHPYLSNLGGSTSSNSIFD